MMTVRHNDIAGDDKIVFLSDLFQDLYKHVPAPRRFQKFLPSITTAGDEVPMTGIVESQQALGLA